VAEFGTRGVHSLDPTILFGCRKPLRLPERRCGERGSRYEENSRGCSQGRISVEWLDKTDCVGSWQSEKLAAVVFCTADCLAQLRNIDGEAALLSVDA
jgi:hypothetical protein